MNGDPTAGWTALQSARSPECALGATRTSRRQSVLALALAAALVFLAGCGERERPVDVGLRENVLKVGSAAEPEDLDPQIVTGGVEQRIILSMFEGIVGEDPKTLAPVPGIADEWHVEDSGLVYTFHVREAARWSNGEPIVAPDLVLSFKRMLSPTLASQYAYMLYHVVGAEEFNTGAMTDFDQVGFKAPDDHTLVITLKHRTPFLLSAMASHQSWWPVNVKSIAAVGDPFKRGTPWTRPGKLVGSGPFKLKEWLPNQRIVVEKSPTYWDAAHVRLNAIEFHTIENGDALERAFRAGQIHVSPGVPLSKIDTYKRTQPEVLHIDPALAVYYYMFNVSRPPMSDVRVRRALALAISRESIVRDVTQAGEAPAYGFVPPGMNGFESEHPLEGTVSEARALLAEAGFPDGKGFPRVTLLYNTSNSHRTMAEAIQQMWRTNLGIEVALENQEWKVYLDTTTRHDYDIAAGVWAGDYLDPHSFLELFETGGGNNATGWSNKRFDELLAQSLKAPDDTARFAIYHEMQGIMTDEVPVMPIYYFSRLSLRDPMVKGYYPTVLDHHPCKYIYLEK